MHAAPVDLLERLSQEGIGCGRRVRRSGGSSLVPPRARSRACRCATGRLPRPAGRDAAQLGRGRPAAAARRPPIRASSVSLRLTVRCFGRPQHPAVARTIWFVPAITIIDQHEPKDGRSRWPTTANPGASGQYDGRLVSVPTPVHDPSVQVLEAAILSIRDQMFADARDTRRIFNDWPSRSRLSIFHWCTSRGSRAGLQVNRTEPVIQRIRSQRIKVALASA